jgi:hypothetical protein
VRARRELRELELRTELLAGAIVLQADRKAISSIS